MKAMPNGYCEHESHAGHRPRERCWSRADVLLLEAQFGELTDDALARKLGRTVLGIRLKAKKLGLHKRDVGLSAREVALLFAVDETVVSKVWIRRGVLKARRSSFFQGPNRMWVVDERELERFIDEQAHWFDAIRMMDSPYRDRALCNGRWYSLPDVMYLTGRHAHVLNKELRAGRWPGRKRGTHWMVHESTIPAIAASAGQHGRFASIERRERTLEHRRNVRKGVEPATHHEPKLVRHQVVDCPDHAGEECPTCLGKGVVLRGLQNGVGIQPLPEAWAA